MIKKNSPKITTIKSWNKLAKEINKFANFPWYIYRGQRRSDWLLESTLSRVLKKIKIPDKNSLAEEHLEKFKLCIRGRRGSNPAKLSENELWALGQHFGLHTPLLDWSQSPYVALFFAFSSIKKSETGYRSLWVLNSHDIERINSWYKKEKKETAEYHIELINPILDENSRLVNQNGLFTKLDIDTDIERWVTNCAEDINWLTLVKINISEKLRDEVLVFLDLMNISYSSLFPDLFGSSMDSNIRLEQADYLKSQRQKIWDAFEKIKTTHNKGS
ncbi:MAG: FRG domain-containing protein [Bacteroidetes bacterium HGW-Bacteroidetes-17]|nr:MAG: FRG domain-containing protein [Bacteroidetes bacterium HGW-Bacteroidetes-17]